MTDSIQKTILIVDDEPDNAAILREVLSTYNREIALSGESALIQVEKYKPDLILLDVMMPDMDGFTVAKRLKENPETADIPIIFVTAKTDVKSFIKGFDVGADDYIMKPYDPKVVQQIVKDKLRTPEDIDAENEIGIDTDVDSENDNDANADSADDDEVKD